MSLSTGPAGADLYKKTLRTVAILVAACVLFVGALSAAALAVTSRAVAAQPSASDTTSSDTNAKKPLSI